MSLPPKVRVHLLLSVGRLLVIADEHLLLCIEDADPERPHTFEVPKGGLFLGTFAVEAEEED